MSSRIHIEANQILSIHQFASAISRCKGNIHATNLLLIGNTNTKITDMLLVCKLLAVVHSANPRRNI